MSSPGPTRRQNDLADVVEMLLDKGVVINADIVVSVGETELLGIQLRAAIASFETAAEYGLEFPEGTDTERIERITERESVPGRSDSDSDPDADRDSVRHSDSGGRGLAPRPDIDDPQASDEPDSDTESGSDSGSASGSDDGSEAESETGSEPESEPEPEAESAVADSDGGEDADAGN